MRTRLRAACCEQAVAAAAAAAAGVWTCGNSVCWPADQQVGDARQGQVVAKDTGVTYTHKKQRIS
jgi:hypothetical protein